jgi:hypothetical protein
MQLNSDVFNAKLYLTLKASARLTPFKYKFGLKWIQPQNLGHKASSFLETDTLLAMRGR